MLSMGSVQLSEFTLTNPPIVLHESLLLVDMPLLGFAAE